MEQPVSAINENKIATESWMAGLGMADPPGSMAD
jgi:hypothetical protein